jgi:hypothetical protein
MQLSTFQRRALEVYRWYRQHPPAWQFYLIAVLRRSSYLIYLGIFGVALLLLLIGRTAAIGGWVYLLLGVIIGIIVRALLAYQQTIRLWPVLTVIIDWDKVDALLQPQSSDLTERHDPSEPTDVGC